MENPTKRQLEIRDEIERLFGEYLSITAEEDVYPAGWILTGTGSVTSNIHVTRGVNIMSQGLNVYMAMGFASALVRDLDDWYDE